jgi:hypothetical protein
MPSSAPTEGGGGVYSPTSGGGSGSSGNTGSGSPVPASNPIPGASGYASAEVMANNAYQKALAQINRNRMNTLLNYGYTGTVNPDTGVVDNVHVDPNAMHGQLQDLFHSQGVQDQQAAFGAEDRGLRGGLAHQAESELRFQHGSQDTALAQALQGSLSDLQDQQQGAGETRDAALWQAEQDAAGQAVTDQQGQDFQTLIGLLGTPQDSPPPSSGDRGSAQGKGGPSPKQKALQKVSQQRAARRAKSFHHRRG